jgi:hypothetical protein
MHATTGDTKAGTAARQCVYRLIWRIRRGRFVRGDLLASILIAAVAPIIQGNPVIMLSAAGRE